MQVNHKDQWEQFNNYLDYLLTEQHRTMEQTDSTTILHRAQGAVMLLRRLKKLKDEVNNVQ
jgi:hypothetical protein